MKVCLRNSYISKGQIEIIKSEDRQDHCQQNETKDMKEKHGTNNTTLKTKAGATRTLQKTRVSSGAPVGKATPASLVAPVVLLS